MKILAFDTTNSLASVAIKIDEKIVFSRVLSEDSKQAEKLFQLINEGLQETNLSFDQLDLVVVTSGPGSFTGVRIGLAAALGMRMFSKAKFFALSNFQVLAFHARHLKKEIMVMLDARRNQIYVQSFNPQLESNSDPQLISIDKLRLLDEVVLVGDGARFIDSAHEKLMLVNPDAVMLANCAEYYFKNNQFDAELSPLYIREPDITISL